MHIVIVGDGTAGWATALLTASRHPNHQITVIESSKIGIIGVGESTTGRLTDVLTNFIYDLGCDHDEFIVETGATLKYAIKHKGWTSDIDDYYIGPIDGSWTKDSIPDPMFNWGINNLTDKELINVSQCGFWIDQGMSNFNKDNVFDNSRHAMHVDAHLVGKYFKKVCLRNNNARHIDSQVLDVNLHPESGVIESVVLQNGDTINGDFFIDCSGFNKVLMNKLGGKWVSYQDNLPVNTGLPFQLKYLDGEMPESYTTAWAQSAGWMWQIPLMDRKGCGYVFDDRFTTPEKAQDEIEMRLGRKIDPIKVIKFNTGRQESAWIKNCITIGLSSAFLEPLEATSIHTTIVQAQWFVFEYLKGTVEETINEGSRRLYNQRTRTIFDDTRDFLVMHYMGNRRDSEFWKYIGTGATKTEFVENLMLSAKTKMPTAADFPQYSGSAGWALYSYVMAGLNLLNKKGAWDNEMSHKLPKYGELRSLSTEMHYNMQDLWTAEMKNRHSYNDFIKHFRQLRKQYGFSDI